MSSTRDSRDWLSACADFKWFIKDRTVGFICHGHSLAEFEAYRDELVRFPIVWGSLNQYWIAENVLKKRLDFVVLQSGVYRDLWHDGYVIQWDRDVERNRGKCTLYRFLEMCIEAGVNRVILFGADGGTDMSKKYYGVENPKLYIGHKQDTKYLNETFPETDMEILNCSQNSNYKPFKKITYEQLIWTLA